MKRVVEDTLFATFKSLTNRSFAFLWSGQVISNLGDSLYQIALAWWVLEKTGSATAMGLVFVFSFTPMVIFLLIGGVAVDRFSRLRLMLSSDLFRATVVGIVAFLAFSKRLEVWHLYIASFTFGFVDAFFRPAYTALIPDMVSSENLTSANSLTTLSKETTNVIGPMIGAILVSFGGTSFAFALDAFSFIISALCLIAIPKLSQEHFPKVKTSKFIQSLREGMTTILLQPWLWVTISIFSLVNITISGPRQVTLPFLIKDYLHGDVNLLGFLYSLISLGAILAALFLGQKNHIRRRGLWAYGATFTCGLMGIVFGISHSISLIAVASIIQGFSMTVFSLIWTKTLQEIVPREKLGRVASIDALGSFALLPLGFALAGWSTELLGPSWVYILSGSITALLALLGLMHPTVRRFE